MNPKGRAPQYSLLWIVELALRRPAVETQGIYAKARTELERAIGRAAISPLCQG